MFSLVSSKFLAMRNITLYTQNLNSVSTILLLFIFTKSFCNFSSVPTVFGNQQTAVNKYSKFDANFKHLTTCRNDMIHTLMNFVVLFIFTKSYFDFSSVPTVFGNQQTEYVNIIKEMLMASLTYHTSYDVRFCAVKGKEKYKFFIFFYLFVKGDLISESFLLLHTV